jgi:hypothetical protein
MPDSSKTEIVVVKLPVASDGAVAREAPMIVYPDGALNDDPRARICDNEPSVVAQLQDDENEARFEAEWDGRTWSLQRRLDA